MSPQSVAHLHRYISTYIHISHTIIYHIVHRGNIDGFDIQVVIRQNCLFQYFLVVYIHSKYSFFNRLSINIFPVKLLNEANLSILPPSKFCAIQYVALRCVQLTYRVRTHTVHTCHTHTYVTQMPCYIAICGTFCASHISILLWSMSSSLKSKFFIS